MKITMTNIIILLFTFLSISSCEEKGAYNPPYIPKEAKAINVDLGKQSYKINPLFFGVCPMYHRENDAEMADGVIEKHLQEMPVNVLRFPGGTESDGYIWNTKKLYDEGRWPYVKDSDAEKQMDTDEFIALCRRIGSEPIICVNTELARFATENEAIKLAADWVQYCKNNNYNVKYWEIGNEPYYHTRFTGREYGELFVKMARAMKAVDPSIKVMAVGEFNRYHYGLKDEIIPDKRELCMDYEYRKEKGELGVPSWDQYRTNPNKKYWWDEVLSVAASEIDVLAIHWYVGNNKEEAIETIPAHIKQLQECSATYAGKELPIAMTEWAVTHWIDEAGAIRAMATAEIIGRFLDSGIFMSTYWSLRDGGGGYGGEHMPKNLLHDTEKTPSANYKAYALFSKYTEEMNRAEILLADDNETYTFATATADKENFSLFVINRSKRTKKYNIQVKDKANMEVYCHTLTPQGNNPNARWEAMTEKSELGKLDNGKITITIAPYSMVTITTKSK